MPGGNTGTESLPLVCRNWGTLSQSADNGPNLVLLCISPRARRNFVHLHLNRPSGQLSSRTPAAIFDLDVRANASPTASPNSSRDPSVFAQTRFVRPYTPP